MAEPVPTQPAIEIPDSQDPRFWTDAQPPVTETPVETKPDSPKSTVPGAPVEETPTVEEPPTIKLPEPPANPPPSEGSEESDVGDSASVAPAPHRSRRVVTQITSSFLGCAYYSGMAFVYIDPYPKTKSPIKCMVDFST